MYSHYMYRWDRQMNWAKNKLFEMVLGVLFLLLLQLAVVLVSAIKQCVERISRISLSKYCFFVLLSNSFNVYVNVVGCYRENNTRSCMYYLSSERNTNSTKPVSASRIADDRTNNRELLIRKCVFFIENLVRV